MNKDIICDLPKNYLKKFEHWEIGDSEIISIESYVEWLNKQPTNLLPKLNESVKG